MRGYSIPEAEKRALAAVWAAADYRVRVRGTEWPLCVGRSARSLEARLPGWSYAFVTAFNPPPGLAGAFANRAANRRLARLIAARGWPATPAEASDGRGGWREPGWLLRNLTRAQAGALARHFRQGGLLYWRRGERVGLQLLWRADDTNELR